MTDRDASITVKAYAALFGVHEQTVYTAIRFGRLKHEVVKIGRTIRIVVPRESIEERRASYKH